MAGAGYKAFADGDVLTAAQVQTYPQDQAVMRFADSSARTSGLGTAVAEGMVSYLQDTDAVEVYDGSAWVSVGPDLVGKIIQVATVTDTTERSTTSTSMTDASISISFTPLAATSTLYVIWVATASCYKSSSNDNNGVFVSLTNSANAALEGAGTGWGTRQKGVDIGGNGAGNLFILIGKSPATDTSARTYKGRFRVEDSANSGTAYLNNTANSGRLLVLEVAA